jgi:hypothetical protein
MIFKVDDVVRGSMTTSQISGGRKNGDIPGDLWRSNLAVWVGERPEELWIGQKNISSELLVKEFAIFTEEAQGYFF